MVCALLLSGCSAGQSSSGAADTAEQANVAGSAQGSLAEGGDKSAPDAAADADRQVVVTGQVSVTVDDPIAAVGEVARLVESSGGYVQERYETAARDGVDASASLVVRVPADQMTATLDRIGEIGKIEDSSLSSTEVTAQARDLDARIRAMKISIGRLEDLLTRSGSVADVVTAEQVLTDRQSQLEQLESQRAALAEQVAMSTLTIQLWPDGTVPTDPPTGFLSGLAAGWNALTATVHTLLIIVGALLPWLAVVGLLIAVGVPVTRRLRRRSAAKAPRSASPGSGPSTALPPYSNQVPPPPEM